MASFYIESMRQFAQASSTRCKKTNLDPTEASNKDDDTRTFENGSCTVIIGVKEFAMMTYRLGASS